MKRKSILVLLSVVLGACACVLCAVIFLGGSSLLLLGQGEPSPQQSLSTIPVQVPASTTLPAGKNVTSVPTPTFAPPKVEVPKPPAPIALPSGSTEAKAAALADAVGPKAQDPLSGWLTVYDALGIPVLGANRTPLGTTGDDPIGPAYWRLWYMSGMARPGSGFPLTDFVKIFNVGGDATFDSAQAGANLLQDLRSASTSKDPRVQLFGRFMIEMVRRGAVPVDLLDPTVTADKVMISGDVAELLSWAVIRNLVLTLAPTTTSSLGSPMGPGSQIGRVALAVMQGSRAAPVGFAVPPAMPPFEQQGCTSLTGEDVTYWLNWALNKIVGGGVQLPGMSNATKGLVEYVQDRRLAKESTIEKVKSLTSMVNSAASVLSLAMQIYALTVDTRMDPSPLVRTKTTTDGDKATFLVALRYDPGRLPDGNQKAACVASFLLNAFGISFSLPGAQRLPGVELLISEGKGFGQTVLWGDFRQRRQDTNLNGEAEVLILGKGQKKRIPDSAKPVAKEFSVHISAQPEAMTANSIANMFFDSLTFWAAPGGTGLINAGVDIAKAMHYDLGEFVLPLTDWVTGYHVDQPLGDGGRVTGDICDLGKPFKLAFVGPYEMTGTFTFTPSSLAGGKWSYQGTAVGGKVLNAETGAYKTDGVDEGVPVINMGAANGVETVQGWGSYNVSGKSPPIFLEAGQGCP